MAQGDPMSWAQWRLLVTTYLRPHRRLVAALAVALFATIALQVVTPQVIRVFIDRATAPERRPIAALAGLYVGAVLLQQAFRVVTAWLGEVVGWLTTNQLRADLMAHCLGLDPGFHATHPPGEMIERVDGDVTGLSQFFAQFLLTVVGNVLLLVGVLVVVTVQNPFAGAVLCGFALVALASLIAIRRIAAKPAERMREVSASLFGYLEERLVATQDIRSSAAEAHVFRGFYDRARERIRRATRVRIANSFAASVNNLLAFVANALAYALPAVLVGRGRITLGGAFVLYFYTQLLMQPLTNVSDQVQGLQQAIAGGRRVLAVLDLRSDVVDGPGADLPAGALAVTFDAVGFGYGDDPDVLDGISIDLRPGEVLGIVGRTGSGKSTIARLLVRLHDPRRGAVRVGGVDVRDLTKAQLRSRVALVTQEVHVLRARVRDNVTLFDPSVPDDRILAAVDRLGLGPWFARLPDGLDTVVGEGGAGVSAGEAQLLSFGRAFLADPSVVVLDEAASRLDRITEALLEAAVDRLLDGRTGIVIAHRLATLERCDTIAILEHGRVVEYGGRAALADDPSSHFGRLLRTGLDVVPT
jgi:ABC-type multidrug transport system fused ATPase/permease subunit